MMLACEVVYYRVYWPAVYLLCMTGFAKLSLWDEDKL